MNRIFDMATDFLRHDGLQIGYIVLALLAGLFIHRISTRALSRWGRRQSFSVRGMQIQIRHLFGPLRLMIPVLTLQLVYPLLDMNEALRLFVGHLIILTLVASVAWLMTRSLALLRDMLLSRYQMNARDNLKARQMYTQIHVIEKILIVVILVLGFSIMLMTFDKVRQLGFSILASAGVLGIIMGFAAQRSIATLFAGIQIAITQPIRIDDVVIVEGEWGRIEEINLTFVVVKIWDLRRLVLPITYFIDTPFQNWTRNDASILGTVCLYTDYTVPVQKVRKVFEDMIRLSEHWDGQVAGVQVTGSTEKTVEIRALMSAADSPTVWNLRCEMREKMIRYLQEHFPESLPRTRVNMSGTINK